MYFLFYFAGMGGVILPGLLALDSPLIHPFLNLQAVCIGLNLNIQYKSPSSLCHVLGSGLRARRPP